MPLTGRHSGPCRYSEALELHPDKAALHLLHANRSAAYCQGGRPEDALADGDAAARLSPLWAKGHWRRGAALLALRRHPEAALAYQQAWKLSKGGWLGGWLGSGCFPLSPKTSVD